VRFRNQSTDKINDHALYKSTHSLTHNIHQFQLQQTSLFSVIEHNKSELDVVEVNVFYSSITTASSATHTTTTTTTITLFLALFSQVAAGQTTKPQVFTRHPCPAPTQTVQPCCILSACGCNRCSWCEVAVACCYHAMLGREHMLSFLTRSSIQGSPILQLLRFCISDIFPSYSRSLGTR